jgi:hypothetical protein
MKHFIQTCVIVCTLSAAFIFSGCKKSEEKKSEAAPQTTSANKRLKRGDMAPSSRPEIQVQGEPVREFEKGKLYVFACWATWSDPSLKAISQLNQFHRNLSSQGVVVTGVSIWEADAEGDKPEMSASNVRSFMAGAGNHSEKIEYPLAVTGKAFYDDWIRNALVIEVPFIFVVNGDGLLLWMGKPDALTEDMLKYYLTYKP